MSVEKKYLTWLIPLATVAVCGYLISSMVTYRIGYPLDDAWIHQTYARNLGLSAEWSFQKGVISAGSTSPFWTGLLAIGYWLGVEPHLWTYVCGLGGLIGVAWIGEAIFRRLTGRTGSLPVMGIFLALEWHLVWAAVSGMETIIFALAIFLVFYWLSCDPPRWIFSGLTAGLAVWIRPDGVMLLGPIGLLGIAYWLKRNDENVVLNNRKIRLKSAILGVLGFTALFIPYLLFNLSISGYVWPNTLFAKQAEYAVILQKPVLERMGELLVLPIVGAGLLLLPGLFFALWIAMRERRWFVIVLFLFWTGYSLVYGFSLPLTYQHGRYLIPVMPVYFLLSAIGMSWLLKEISTSSRMQGRKYLLSKRVWRLLRFAWVFGTSLLLLVFCVIGGLTYAEDVAIIETEMVETANWLSENIPQNARVAVHDIGAIGYFSEVEILDLAGLISPEVIPFLRDETKLAKYLEQEEVSYLVTFPGWYPELVKNGELIFCTSGKFAPKAGGENMAVYHWGQIDR